MKRINIVSILLIIIFSNFLKIYSSGSPKQLKVENKEELIKKSLKSNLDFFVERLAPDIPKNLIGVWKEFGKEILYLSESYLENDKFGYICGIEQTNKSTHNLILAVYRWDLITIIKLLKLGICPECKCACFRKENLYANSAIDLAHQHNLEATRVYQKNSENRDCLIKQHAAELIFTLLCKHKQEDHVDSDSDLD